jgi:hypothetical protein
MDTEANPPGEPESELEAKIRSIVRQELGAPKPVEERLTLRQTAKLLGVCGDTLTRYRKAGKVVAYREKGRVYFKKHEVEAANIKPRGKAGATPAPTNS